MRKVTFFFVFICSCIASKSNEIATDYFIGKVFLSSGDTITTKIHLSYYKGDFVSKLYMDNFGHYLDTKRKVRGLNPNKINGFEVVVDSLTYTFISKQTSKQSDKKVFCHLLNSKNSPVKLFEYYTGGGIVPLAVFGGVGGAIAGSGKLSEKQFIIEYLNGANESVIYLPKRKDFRYDKLAFILSDNKELERKIEDQVYKYDDMPLIIAEYNNWYSTK